jgi:methylenetetrahydrofolate dehydrogenase (NADP+) / methenyltetrahydrofolate cyclohydrolase
VTIRIDERLELGADRPSSEATGARLLHGGPLAADIRANLVGRISALREAGAEMPGVSVLLVGSDSASAVYARRILTNAERLGLPGRLVALPAEATTDQVVEALARESADDAVAGIIVQQPLPLGVDLARVREALDPAKDIDGIHPHSAGLLELGAPAFYPSCAEAAVQILRWTGIEIAGRRVVVIGRSSVVGKPVALLLLREHASVMVCHRQTKDLAAETRRADIVVAAAGSPGVLRGDMLQPGATVVDCGINVVDGSIVGDVDAASVTPVAGALTPVPGGVGPVTNALLMRHLVIAVERRTPDRA